MKPDHKMDDEIVTKIKEALDKAPNIVEFRGLTSKEEPNDMVLFFWTDAGTSAVWMMTKEQGRMVANKILEMADGDRRIIV